MKQKSLEFRNSKFGKIWFVTEFDKWHSGSEFEEQNSAVCSNIRQHLPTFNMRAKPHSVQSKLANSRFISPNREISSCLSDLENVALR